MFHEDVKAQIQGYIVEAKTAAFEERLTTAEAAAKEYIEQARKERLNQN